MGKQNVIVNYILPSFISFVFIQSLFFKFTDSAETEFIFSTLDSWAAIHGYEGVFLPPSGLFNQYIIGIIELTISVIFLYGMYYGMNYVHVFAAFGAFVLMTSAIYFHLATPLGIVVMDDGGTLFIMACMTWISSVAIIFFKRNVRVNLTITR